jgi:hypothetical protein
MTHARYSGHATALYMDYTDAATGRTLTAEPGQSYDVAPAPGRSPGLPLLPGDGKWTAIAPPAPDGPEVIRPAPWPETVNLPPLPQIAPGTGEPPTGPAAPEGEPAPESEG